MKSPFPGIDPYIEGHHQWPDFHSRFINSWCEAISDQLPPPYSASIDERVEIREVDTERDRRLILPDVSITQQPPRFHTPRHPPETHPSASAALETVTLDLPAIEEVKARHIEILHLPERSLVAVLELLSPANKNFPRRGEYLARRADLLAQPIHFVELDLLLAGRPMPMARPLPPADFYAIVARSDARPKAQVYAWSLCDPLPIIAIPLLNPDPDIRLDLNDPFAAAYARARYWKSIPYDKAPDLPLEDSQIQWILQTAKNRP